ncbi:glycerol-3-phosphate dehydrogenase/oxidase [Allobranchiibius sp. CTAmp26]|uniref:glycerol-3-phosphate dehydrogenase/oxidase n=1 Tax=Allobranchiibius sp. CTAmp26 TaxID=2815214 RepID=UPI001AA11082|nr:glycerol-3-phosphate dehydrogenase/oxidase [Allobranchiibius sp. CTAmp26]MBO1756686.1 glycerol-3-phosphate dehydrogenase/oxidase [Allobranchiibius sp. CTAmp26]
MARDTALNGARRARELAEVTDGRSIDLLVIGLGATGAGVALDAASRGLSVVAIDAHDLAFGTSRWSSKLAHGGLRYLAHGQIGIAHESAAERGILLRRTAPHLVRPSRWLVPLTPDISRRSAAIIGAGFAAGDVLRRVVRTPSALLPRPGRVGAAQARALAPALRHDIRGGITAWDARIEDDARLVVALARTAAGEGARVLTRVRALEVTGDGARVRDELAGTTHDIKARAVVNAAGVWAAGLVPDVALRPSRGTHLVLRTDTLGGSGVIVNAPVPGSIGRFVFSLPQPDGRTYLGLTDEAADGPVPDVPVATDGEIDFLLDTFSRVLERPLTRADVVGTYAGLRPLLDAGGSTADISRRHAVLTSPDGVVTVIGGKLTTYRRMAEDAVDAVVRERGLTAAPCRTHDLPLVGAAAPAVLARVAAPDRLVHKYGTEAPALTADADLLTPVGEDQLVTRAELVFGVTHEGALDVDDLLDRRTRIGLVATDRAAVLPAATEALDSYGS